MGQLYTQRIYFACFSAELGGQEAADEWYDRMELVVNFQKKFGAIAPIFGDGGVLNQADMLETREYYEEMQAVPE